MSRFNIHKVAWSERARSRELLSRLLARVESLDEFRALLGDLLSNTECVMLIRRIFVARMMFEGVGWKEIKKSLRAGTSLVHQVSARIAQGGKGYETAVKKLRAVGDELTAEIHSVHMQEDPGSFESLINKHSRSFWPVLAVREAPKIARNIAASVKRKRSRKK